MQSLRVAQPLDVPGDRLREQTEHLPNRERDAHSVRSVRMASDQAPERPKRDNRLDAKPTRKLCSREGVRMTCSQRAKKSNGTMVLVLTTDMDARTPMFSKSINSIQYQ